MRHSTGAWSVLLCLALGLGLTPVRSALPELSAIRSAHSAIRDFSLTMLRSEIQERELRRMKNADMALEVPKVRVYFVAPDRLRLEGKRGLISVTLVQNGNIKQIHYGPVHKRQDTTGAPDKKQGGLDFGLLTEQVWTDFRVTIEATQQWEGRPAVVLHLVARSSPEGSYHRVWVDEETLRVLQVEDHTGEGYLKRRQVFRNPVKGPDGAWMARRIEIFNQYDRFVGALGLTDMSVNRGLSDHLFHL